ncbi:restriction endonuclease subunit S [uncultured Eubacterium sp.]|uniref:restriction endonuclease subunit S n=1 Tax=uncultured Eubacterium sp. TaxID=165185 RepID=UPI00263A03C1|nr:restriction endonuclease subunit S [uncultured Eubacterium sp.]
MKYSGVEWIGEIPKDWEILPTKRFFSHTKTLAGDKVDTYERLALTMNGVIKRSKDDSEGLQPEKFDTYQVLKENELVFKLIDLANVKTSRVGLSPFTGIVSPAYIVLTNESDDNRFYYYFFISMYYNEIFNRLGDNGVRSSLNAQDLLSVPIVNISSDTQHRIADFLDDKCGKIDRYIEKLQQIIDKLKEYKQAVITEAVTKGLDPDVPMKDSGIEWIGMIPEHWDVPEIKYLVRIASGGTPDRNHPEYWNGNIPWIKTGELQNDIITNAEEYITEEGLNNSSAQVFNINTILVAMYGQGKTRGMTALLKTPASTNQACAGLTVTNSNVQIEYLWQCLIGAYDAIRSEAAGSGQPNLSATLIGNFHIALPPIEEQGLIVEYIKDRTVEIKSTIHKAEKLLEKLTEYKKSLIYEAVTGKLEV